MFRFQCSALAILFVQLAAAQFMGWGEGSRESNSKKVGDDRPRRGNRSWGNAFGIPGVNATYDYVVSTSLTSIDK